MLIYFFQNWAKIPSNVALGKKEKFFGITQVINLAVKTKPTCVARTAQQKCKLKALFRNLLCNFVKI